MQGILSRGSHPPRGYQSINLFPRINTRFWFWWAIIKIGLKETQLASLRPHAYSHFTDVLLCLHSSTKYPRLLWANGIGYVLEGSDLWYIASSLVNGKWIHIKKGGKYLYIHKHILQDNDLISISLFITVKGSIHCWYFAMCWLVSLLQCRHNPQFYLTW